MVESAWLNDGDEVVPKVFMDAHTNNNCISKVKFKDFDGRTKATPEVPQR